MIVLELMDRADRNVVAKSIEISGLDDPKLTELVPADLLEKFLEEIEMARELMPKFDHQSIYGWNYDAYMVRICYKFLWGTRTL